MFLLNSMKYRCFKTLMEWLSPWLRITGVCPGRNKEVFLHAEYTILPEALCYPVIFFFNIVQYINIKILQFTPSAALHDHEKLGLNQAVSQIHKDILVMGNTIDLIFEFICFTLDLFIFIIIFSSKISDFFFLQSHKRKIFLISLHSQLFDILREIKSLCMLK